MLFFTDYIESVIVMYADYSHKLAKLIVNYSVGVKPGDKVLINTSTNAEELTKEIYREVLIAGGNVVRTNFGFDGQEEIFYKYSSDEQLQFVDPLYVETWKQIDKMIAIYSSFNTRALTNVSPEKKTMVAKARSEITKIYLERAGKKELRWNLSPFPCNSFAQEANMGLQEYIEFAYKALNLHRDDPVAFWKRIESEQEKIVEILNKGSEMRIIGNDTDLVLGINGRTWENCCGHENLPDGEVFTAPHEDNVNGTVRFTFPGIYQGQEIENVKLTFKDGKVVDSIAAKGDDLLNKILEIPNANILGELAVGTNYGIQTFTKNMLFDEKMGGTIHLALGSGYPETGSKNESAIHWDLLKDMKDPEAKIKLDGTIIYQEGKWLIP
ncbi:MAG: aminopeptidase [Candidatus Hodarchaeales archaeon]|jgi:aminopeptidase